VDLSAPEFGLRHVQVTLDATGTLLTGSDIVMFVRETAPGGDATLTDHESIGGRFEVDSSFRGTCWKSRLRSLPESDESETVWSESAAPTDDQIAALRRLVADVLGRR